VGRRPEERRPWAGIWPNERAPAANIKSGGASYLFGQLPTIRQPARPQQSAISIRLVLILFVAQRMSKLMRMAMICRLPASEAGAGTTSLASSSALEGHKHDSSLLRLPVQPY
jgi:hypothetical protein